MITKLSSDQIVGCESYYRLANYEFDHIMDDNYPDHSIIHVHMNHINEFFSKINGNGRKYVVVSSRSDYGIFYQQEFPVWADMYKSVKMFSKPDWYYNGLQLPPRCDLNRCLMADKYSIKMYMWTKSTFNRIPENVVRWFCTNCCIKEPRVEGIPFGVNNVDGGTQFFDLYNKIKLKDKSKLLYVNFQLYTNERSELIEYFHRPWATVKRDIPFEEYMNDLNEHQFCLCPAGNGIDCYRVLEALYMGCIPIVETHPGFNYLHNTSLPIIQIDNFHRLNEDFLNRWYNQNFHQLNWSLKEATLSYWKDKINEGFSYGS